jgi:hypothetical protein
MVAPSRTASLDVSALNTEDFNAGEDGLTEYERLRNKRKEALHVQIQLALLNDGVVLDDRVLRGFDGKPPPEQRSTGGDGPPLAPPDRRVLVTSTATAVPRLRKSLRRREKSADQPPMRTSPAHRSANQVCILSRPEASYLADPIALPCRVVRCMLLCSAE